MDLKNKRGVMGLDTSKAFLVGLLSLVIIGVVVVIVLTNLQSATILTETTAVNSELGGFGNSTGYTLAALPGVFASPTIVGVLNGTAGAEVTLTNVTVSSLGVVTNATSYEWFNLTFNYTYTTQGDSAGIVANASSGLESFFSNTGTWLTLLSVVILILIIGAVIAVVNKFGAGRDSIL